MNPTVKARLLGLFILVVGAGGNAYMWYSVLFGGVYWQKATIIFPIFAFLGLSMIIYPISKEESLAKYGSAQIPWKHIPLGQKLLVGIGILAGFAQWAFFSGKL